MKKNILMIILTGLSLAAGTGLSAAPPTEKKLLLKNGHVLPVGGDDFDGDVLIVGTRIAKLGKGLAAGPDTEVIDLKGQWVMPGIIDSHSHIAIEGNVNESGDLLTPEVDILDVLNPEDINIYYALTGGVTSIHTMHGSANPIGGRGIVLKLKWGAKAEDMIFKGAPRTVKWALGENPKQSNFSGAGKPRYPRSRMGVEASIRDEFEQAKDYMRQWQAYDQKVKAAAGKKDAALPLPPRKNYRLEVVADILRGKYWVRCHAYQGEEMASIIRLCKEYGVKLACFEHGLEGYRITNELAANHVAVSTFEDFWAYKWEAYQTMPQSAALMIKRGVLVALNSDDAERMRRLFFDACKAVRFGGLTELEALKTITLNPAIIDGVDKYTGTLEVGKDADIAVFNRHPLDPYAVCQMTLVDGKVYFDRAKYLEDRQKAEEAKKKAAEAPKPKDKED
ncbi:MAG TPA: amidohydrolase family protein [Terriglobales bacterium]|nr:amidohydrolase family protein [Terriglobales bacterium]